MLFSPTLPEQGPRARRARGAGGPREPGGTCYEHGEGMQCLPKATESIGLNDRRRRRRRRKIAVPRAAAAHSQQLKMVCY